MLFKNNAILILIYIYYRLINQKKKKEIVLAEMASIKVIAPLKL
jgi:hypothetical protein